MHVAPEIPLRARKQARTRRALLAAALDCLDGSRTLDDVNVRELCEAASISEASFFNYFPKKTDLLVYYIRLWSLDLAWRVRHELGDATARESIEEIFVATARAMRDHPGVMPEIIALQARATAPPEGELELADRVLAFPDRPGIETVPAIGLEGLMLPLIDRAIRDAELPASTDRKAALLTLAAVFFGVPLVVWRRDPSRLEAAYREQLSVAWAGLTHAPRRQRRKPRRSAVRKGGSS